jgi:two-component system, OmpR family, response regulator
VEPIRSGVGSSPRVLIIEDDGTLRSALTQALEMVGYEVRALEDGTEVAQAVESFRPDLVGIDVYLPHGPDGFEVAKQVRSLSSVPMVFLTAADGVRDRLRGFDLGADDYVVKPFSMAELLARVRALLRRAGRLTSATWEVRDLLVDEQNRVVIRADQAVDLTPTEFDLLCLLGRSPGRVYSKAQLLSEIWGVGVTDPNLVEVCMSSLRRKLDAHGPRLIFTQRGRGYFLRS